MDAPFTSLEALGASLAAAGVSWQDQRKLLALAKPCAALASKATPDDQIAIGASKIGGSPDVPGGFIWPQREATATGLARIAQSEAFNAEHGASLGIDMSIVNAELARERALYSRPAPLTFLLQVDLAECAASGPLDADLPRAGRLLVFYDLVLKPWWGHEEDGRLLFQVVYDMSEPAALSRQTPPDLGEPLFGEDDAYAAWRNCLPVARLSPVFTWTLPDGGSEPLLLDYVGRNIPHAKWLGDHPTRTHLSACNRLGGWPENIQGDMPIELVAHDTGITLGFDEEFRRNARALRAEGAQWVQLFQIGDYDNSIMDFDGLLHVWIKRDDLKARKFDKARLIFRTS